MSQSLRRSVSQHYYHRQQRNNTSLSRSNSFKMQRRVYHRMCDCCGQSHEKDDNHLYDYPIEVEEELMCQVCLQPLVDPVDTPCGHTFCRACALRQIRLHKACPIDRQRLTEDSIRRASNLVRNILDKLNVVCPNTAYCDATMPRSSLERHLKHLCPGTYTRCPRNALGCTFVGPRNQLTDHLWGCVYGNDVDPITGIKLEVVDDIRCLVEIPKGTNDLGLNVTICERTGALVIQDVYHNGNGYKDGRLRRGDQILSIDGQNFSNKSIAQARLALSTTRPLVAIVVLRSNNFDFKMPELPQVEEVELVRDEDRPLGINIYTSKNHPGIYINNIEPGSLAESCERLLVGDRILEANGYNIRHVTIDEAAARMDEAYGPVRLLVAHRMVRRRSPCSSDHSSSSGRYSANRVYEEVKQRTGYRVGALKCVLLKKEPHESFGMSVSGGIGSSDGDIPIYVSGIRPDSVVDKCSDIQRGDIILSVSDISLIDKTHSEAVQIMKSVSGANVIRLEMIQGDNQCGDEDDDGCLSPEWEEWMDDYRTGRSSPIEMNITLPRASNESLGFSVVGGIDSPRGDSPIYVKGIASRGVAADDGRLKSRDQILRVNGVSVDGMRQDEVVRLIKAFSGDITLTVIPHHYTNV